MAKLRTLREDNDLTQAQVAEILGTSQTMVARYERGANELPLRHLAALCPALQRLGGRSAGHCAGPCAPPRPLFPLRKFRPPCVLFVCFLRSGGIDAKTKKS